MKGNCGGSTGSPLRARIRRHYGFIEHFETVFGNLQCQVSIAQLVGDKSPLLESPRPDHQDVFLQRDTPRSIPRRAFQVELNDVLTGVSYRLDFVLLVLLEARWGN